MSKIYLIRHGQASFLANDYDHLSEKGIKQSEALGKYLLDNDIYFDKIYIGNLKRHKQTFEAYSKAFKTAKIQLPVPIFLNELNEHKALDAFKFAYEKFVEENNMARILVEEIALKPNLEKKNYLKIFYLFFNEFISGKFPLNNHPVQSWKDFRVQAKKGINTILSNTNSGEIIGVFTSGGTKSSIIGDSLNLKEQKILDLNMAIRNASFSQLYFSNKNLNILSINEVPHLNKKLITFV